MVQECYTEPRATELAKLRQERRAETDHITYDCMHVVATAPGESSWPACRFHGKRVDRSLLNVLEGCTAPLCLLCSAFAEGDEEASVLGGSRSVDELAMPLRARNALLSNDITTVAELLPLKGIDIMGLNRAGPRTAAQVMGALDALGIRWGF